MDVARKLITKINGPDHTLGVLATDHAWADLPPLLQSAGLDYLIVDMEHGAYADDTVAHICTSGRQVGFPVLIRTVSTDYPIVRRAVDLGPCGLMFPCVESSEQLDAVRDAVWMPPRGRRRPGGHGNRWVSDYHYETWRESFEDDFIVLPQIESRRGLANLDAIARHALTTALAIGPYDLSADLGCCWQPQDVRLQDALGQIRGAAKAAGKNVWMLGDAPALAREGYTFLAIGEPSVMLKLCGARQIAERIRGGEAGPERTLAAEHG